MESNGNEKRSHERQRKREKRKEKEREREREQKNGRVSSLFTEHRVAPVQFDLKTLERYITPTSVLLLSTSFLRLTFHRQTEGAKHTSVRDVSWRAFKEKEK